MKKVVLGAMVAAMATGATSAMPVCSSFNGFYVGGGLDYINEKVKSTWTKTNPSKSGGASASTKGVGAKFFAGYGAAVVQGLYLGGELTLGWDRLFGNKHLNTQESDDDDDRITVKKLNYGVAARVGYVFSSVLPYLKFGYEGRQAIKIPLNDGSNFSVKRNGFILGAGFDAALTKNVFVRLEYVHGFGGKSSNSYKNAAGTRTTNFNFKTSSDTFLIGAGYKF